MKNTMSITMLFILAVLFSHCDKDDSLITTCDSEGGVTITDQRGRIYKWTNSLPHFYYIGNVSKVSNGINGGYIPCNELPGKLQKEGVIVEYSGIDKGSPPDTGDPLFGYIIITKIKKVE
ncbi:MAG: hypothetical protein JJU28_21570 [Cyclobacteriaceae bacterium]|nr:hypothetical protein [Cyclobacteriaceae bacterium]